MGLFSRRTFVAQGIATVAIAATGQINRVRPAMAATRAVNLYSSRHYNTDSELYGTFTRQTGIKVNLVEGKADELIERIKSEGDNSPADVFITVDAGRLWRAEAAELFAPVNAAVLTERIPASLSHPDGLWFGFSRRARVLMYNQERVDPATLSTYEDLANPRWQGRLLVRSSNNVYNQSLVAAMIEAHGVQETEDWCRGLVANFARPPQGNDRAQIEAAAAGVGDVAIANTYYLARYRASRRPTEQAIGAKIGVFFPNQTGRGAHVNISGGGLVKTAPNPEGAIQFLEYLASPAAQRFFTHGNFEYPVVEGIPWDPVLESFGPFKADPVNVSVYGRNSAEAIRIMDRAGWT